MNFVDFEWPVWPGPRHSRLQERAQSISEFSQHALCTGLPVTQKTVPWIRRLTISSVKMTEGFSGGLGRSAAHSYLCTSSWHACCLLLLLFYWFSFLFSLSPRLPISNKPSWWPRLTCCRNERGPLATQRNEWLTAVYIHWWNKETLLSREVPHEAFTVPSSEVHIGNM